MVLPSLGISPSLDTVNNLCHMTMRVAVIGAGPSGLVTLKYLLAAEQALGTAAVEVRLFESEAGVGGTFFSRMYEDAEVCDGL